MADLPELAAVLRCPRCMRGALTLQRAGWMCGACSSGFPVMGEIPWLFPEPQASVAEWRGRLQFLVQELEREARVTRAELSNPQLSTLTQKRLGLWADANEDQARRLVQFLQPLGIGTAAATYETHLALRTRLPSDQGLTNYYVNVHRDWAWGDEENQASLSLIRSSLPDGYSFGRTLVLGAGAGRLAYDLHMQCRPTLTVAADFNPLLLFVARDVVAGKRVELYEFPIAPRRLEDQAVLRALAAPEPVRSGFFLVGADALHAPFTPGAFDTVVTPWFIDIIAEELSLFAVRLNVLLADGGSWINFGSLSFSQAARAARLTLEEARDTAEQAGFTRPQICEDTIPYMRSPASRHSRMETVVAWCARKERAVPEPSPYNALPEWLLFTDRPVPRTEDFQVQAVSTRIHAFLMALIDGRRSVQDMARMLVEQRLMTAQDAEPAVRRFLARMYEDSQRRAGF